MGAATPHDTRTPSKLIGRHPVAGTFLLLVLVLIAAIGTCEWLGWPFLRQPLQRTLAKHLDRDIEIGSQFQLRLLGSIRLRTDALDIGPPRWAPAKDQRFFDAHDVALTIPWSTIWNVAVGHKPAPLRVKSLEIGSFDATLWRQQDGRANWDFAATPRPANQTSKLPEFDSLVVRAGRLSLDDAPDELHMKAEARTTEGASTGKSAAAGGGNAGLNIQGSGRYREGDFNFTVHSDGVLPLLAPDGSSTVVPMTLRAKSPHGHFTFDGQARDILHLNSISGRFTVGGTSLAEVGAPFGVTLPTTARFDAQGTLGKTGQVWKTAVARFDVGSSRLSGDFTFDRRPQVPLLSGVLRGSNLDLIDLGPAFGSPAPGADNPPKPTGKVFPSREFDIASLQRMNASVDVALDRLDLHTSYLQALAPARAKIKLQDGVLTVEQLDARTSGGQVQGKLGLDGRNVQQPRWTGDLRVAGVELQEWIKTRDTHIRPKAGTAERVAAKDPAASYVTGRLGGHLVFSGTGRSVASMLGTLDGDIAAWVNGGTISHLAMEAAGLDIAQGLGVLIKGDDALPMRCAAAQFTARDGLLQTEVGIVDSPDTTVIMQGALSLAKEELALVVQANPKDFSPATLRSPLHLDGPFIAPHIRLDPKPIGLKAAAAVALGILNPLAALIPLIDPGKKAPYGCQQAIEALRGTTGRGLEPPKQKPAGR